MGNLIHCCNLRSIDIVVLVEFRNVVNFVGDAVRVLLI